MTLTKVQREFVRQRAGQCCEYCRLSAIGGTLLFHVDHIIPQKHGGTNDDNNLCLACYKCNSHKSHDLTGFDPETGEISRFYHPRHHQWNGHFELLATMEIIGKTPEGRATVNVFQMNAPDRVETRRILAEVGEYPCQQSE